ncbi:MAG: morphogenetic protein [Gammaproteobacteria bacterium]|nr:morphogenetic protein [Gammaproteobacteria bacterium]MBU1834275.1 morphogenetic protein [Gammaproteobacteria bacterium]
MKERPILFNGEMVRAILDGHKTQTRRLFKLPKSASWLNTALPLDDGGYFQIAGRQGYWHVEEIECPIGFVGDRLWVRETWARYNIDRDSHDMAYRATAPNDWPKDGRWRPSIHMPRWASRITLEITGVRVERLQAITEQDAREEGITDGGCLNCGEPEPCGCENPAPDARDAFSFLWQSIHGQDSWHQNPWVWVIEFKRVDE